MTIDHLPRRTSTIEEGPKRPLTSLVAAARKISGHKMKRSAPESWQDEGWDLYDEVGELRFVANSLANSISRARIFAARLPMGDDEPHPIAGDDEDDTADDLIAAQTVKAIGGGALGRSELLRRLGVQMFVPGDGYIVGLPDGMLDDDEPRADADPSVSLPVQGGDDEEISLADLDWHALSVNEVAFRGSTIVLKIGDEDREIDPNQAIVVRVWRPHPRRWWAADSPVRANLPVLRELVGLTKHVGASIDSRLAGAGLLVLGNSVEVVSASTDDGTGDADADEVSNFVDALIETMTTPIRDRDSAAAVVPLTIKVPDDVVDKIQHITFSTPFDDKAKDLRDEAIRRLALGLDAPPETLLGMGGANHWSAWQIEESTVKVHIEPVLALICDALTTEYLWPVLQEAGIADYREYVVWFDTTELTLRPNRAGEAQAVHGVGALSDEALRRESGFSEDDAPKQPDRAVEISLRMVQDQPMLIVDPGLPSIIATIREAIDKGVEREEAEDGPMEIPLPDAAAEAIAENEGGSDGTPDTQGDGPDLEVTASLSVPRHRERVGPRG